MHFVVCQHNHEPNVRLIAMKGRTEWDRLFKLLDSELRVAHRIFL